MASPCLRWRSERGPVIHRPSRRAPGRSSLSLLVAGAAAPPALSLLPSATAQDGAAEIEPLSVALRLESIERVVGSIVTRVKRVAPEKTALVEAKLHPGEAFARTHATSNLETMLDALFQAELASGALTKERIKVDLHLFRAYDGGAWQIKPVKDVPTARTGFQPPRTAGYPAEVAAIDPSAAHSMHDLGDYLADRFTHATLERIVREGRPVEIHLGSPTDALQDLVNRRFELLGEVKTPAGELRRHPPREVAAGRAALRAHRHGRRPRPAPPPGRPPALRRPRPARRALGEADPRRRRRGPQGPHDAEHDGHALAHRRGRLHGDRGLQGLAPPRAPDARAAAPRVRVLHDVLGADPYEGLKAKLAAERDAAASPARESLAKLVDLVANDAKLASGLRTTPELVLTTVEGKKALSTVETKLLELSRYPASTTLAGLLADGQLRLPGGASAKEATIGRDLESGSLKAEELRVTTPRGVEPLKLVSNYYGDAMGDLVKALIGSGHRTIAYFGTAGGTGAGVKIGDIHVPSSVYDFRFELASGGVKNAFLDYFAAKSSALGERLRLDTKLGNVYSPAEETMAWLEETRTRGIAAVEVENSYITREVARHNAASAGDPVKLFTSVIISGHPRQRAHAGRPRRARPTPHLREGIGGPLPRRARDQGHRRHGQGREPVPDPPAGHRPAGGEAPRGRRQARPEERPEVHLPPRPDRRDPLQPPGRDGSRPSTRARSSSRRTSPACRARAAGRARGRGQRGLHRDQEWSSGSGPRTASCRASRPSSAPATRTRPTSSSPAAASSAAATRRTPG